MAYKTFDDLSTNHNNMGETNTAKHISIESGANQTALPDTSYIQDANMTRDGYDLVLETADGTLIIDGYFASEPPPSLVAPDGTALTPNLVESFVRGGNKYADAGGQTNDSSPVGAIQEISGEATVTRLDGTIETAGIGTPIYPGDIVETDEDGAVNIMFVDETTFAVSEDARLSIDEYVFDPATQSGETNFSVLKGVFVFTSGLIGRDDPDDVTIDTPSGSIGIRGTIIAGNVDTGEITVIEGAIVLQDLSGNSITLANQFETARFNPSEGTIDSMGELSAHDVSSKFSGISNVSGTLFSSIQDAAQEQEQQETKDTNTDESKATAEDAEATGEETQKATNEDAGEGEAQVQGDGEIDKPQLQELITSDDITGKTDISPTGEPKLTPPPPPQNIEATEQPELQPEPEAQLIAEPPPPFSIAVSKLAFAENDNGENVARITGNFTNLTNISLVGVSNNFYEIIRENPNTLLVKLQSGVSIDRENPYDLTIQASNESGGANIVQKINMDIINVDEPVVYTAHSVNNSGGTNFFSGAENSNFAHNFSHEFSDPEGNITSYQLISVPTHSDLAGYDFNTTTGIMTINLDGDIGGPASFGFTIRANTASGYTDNGFTFDVYNNTTPISSIYTSDTVYAAGTYAGTNATLNIAANNINVFMDSDNTANTIDVAGTNAFIKAGAGNDNITIQAGSTGYNAFGDGGHDTFNIADANGYAYGNAGNDQFIFTNAGTMGTLESAGGGTLKFDGGMGDDLFHLSTAGNIDFTAVNDTLINNIEKIAFINAQTNNITLNYTDVIAMTDDHNTLKIDMDNNDTLTFINSSGNQFYLTGQDTQGMDQYNIYSDGAITLFVDTDGSASGIVA